MPEHLQQLVHKAMAGDTEAFGDLYSAHFESVYDFLVRLTRDPDDAADLAQETFLRALDSIASLREPGSFKSWLFSIAHHAAMTRLRQAGSYRPIDSPDGGDGATRYDIVDTDRLADPEAAALAQEVRSLVWEAVAALDPRQRAVLTLHVREDMDIADLATSLGVTRNNAAVILHRARKALEDAVGAAIVARAGRRRCLELAAIVAAHDESTFSTALRTAVEAHIETCGVCRSTRRKLTPLAVLGALAPVAGPAGLRDSILESLHASEVGSGTSNASGNAREEPQTSGQASRLVRLPASTAGNVRLVLRVAAGVALVVIAVGIIAAAVFGADSGPIPAGANAVAAVQPTSETGSPISSATPVTSAEAGSTEHSTATAEPPAKSATLTPTPPLEPPRTSTPAPAPIAPGEPELPVAPPGGDPAPPPTEPPPPTPDAPPPISPEARKPLETGESNRGCSHEVTASPGRVDLSVASPAGRVRVTASGDCPGSVAVTLSGAPDWLQLSHRAVEVAPGAPADIMLTLVESRAPREDARATLTFTWDGDSAQVAVIFIAEDRTEPREPAPRDDDEDDGGGGGSPRTGPGDITSPPPTSPTPPCSSIICP